MTRVPLILAFAAGCATPSLAGWITTELRASSSAPRLAATDARIVSLERRVAALEGQTGRAAVARRVTAPFEVVDRNGRRVFSVGEDRVARLYNVGDKDVVRLVAGDSGGSILTSNAASSALAAMGATGTEANVKIMETGGIVRAELGSGTTTNGKYRLLFTTKTGKSVAKIGEGDDAPVGAAWVADANGNIRADMGIDSARSAGGVGILNAAGTRLGVLTEGQSKGGLFALFSSDGKAMVDAGVLPDGVGVVRAGPGSFMLAAGVGLPGSFIMGKK